MTTCRSRRSAWSARSRKPRKSGKHEGGVGEDHGPSDEADAGDRHARPGARHANRSTRWSCRALKATSACCPGTRRCSPRCRSASCGTGSARKSSTSPIAFGFVEVLPDRVTVLAQIAERAQDIDVARAEAAKKCAEERVARVPPQSDHDFERARIALMKSMNRLQVASRARTRV